MSYFCNAVIHPNASRSYHSWPGNQQLTRGMAGWVISRSELLQVAECPAMFRAGGKDINGKSIDTGSLVDCLLTTPAEVDKIYSVQPQVYTKTVTKGRGDKKHVEHIDMPWTRQSKTCRDWIKEQEEAGKIVVSQRDFAQAQRMAQAVRHHVLNHDYSLGNLLDACEKQVVITADWNDPSGMVIPCRAMIDLARDLDSEDGPIAYDLKTSKDIDRKRFKWAILGFGYDVQAWMYGQMLNAAVGLQGCAPFGFIAVRNTPPYLVATYMASPATLLDGEEKFRNAMHDYSEALRAGRWRSYTQSFELI